MAVITRVKIKPYLAGENTKPPMDSAEINELRLKLNYWALISRFARAAGHFDLNCLFHFLRRARGAFECYDGRIALLP